MKVPIISFFVSLKILSRGINVPSLLEFFTAPLFRPFSSRYNSRNGRVRNRGGQSTLEVLLSAANRAKENNKDKSAPRAVPGIFNTSSRNNPTNFGFAVSDMVDLEGAVTNWSVDPETSITVAAGCKTRTVAIDDIGGAVALESTEQNSFPIYLIRKLFCKFWGTAPFSIQFFFVLMEDGQQITSSDGASADAYVTISSALGAQDFALKTGPILFSNHILDNGTSRYVINQDLDETPLFNAYSRYFQECELRQDAHPKELFMGVTLNASAPGTFAKQVSSILGYYSTRRQIAP